MKFLFTINSLEGVWFSKMIKNRHIAISNWAAGFLFSAVVSACTFHILFHQINLDWHSSIIRSQGVMSGYPDWIAFQNRLLGPMLVQAIHLTGIEYDAAHMFVQAFAWLLNCALVYVFVTASGRSPQTAIIAVTSFAIIFLFSQYRRLLIWDSLDLLMMTTLAYLAFSLPRLRYLIPLFIFGILNRESGLFVALFILIDAFDTDALLRLRIRVTNWFKFWTGISLMLIGIIYVKSVRTLFFIETRGGTDDIEHQLIGNHFQIFTNLRGIIRGSFLDTNFAHTAMVAALVATLLFFFWNDTDRRRKGAILTLSILANILMFGIFRETRTLLPLLPLALFYGLDRWSPGKP